MNKPKPNSKQDPALLKAVLKGDLKGVQACIAAGVNINAAAKDEVPALFGAISSGKLEVVKALLAASAEVNCVSYPSRGASLKSTPLCYAIEKGHWEITQALLQAGADVALEPVKGDNAAGLAAQRAAKQFHTVTASEDDWLGRRRTKVVLNAAKADCELWMKFVRDAIARGVKIRDYWLWNAINHRHRELALMLIAAGVNPNAAPHLSSALGRALEFGLDDIALALINAGATVHPKAGMMEPAPLLSAAQHNRLAVIPELIKAGADINVTGDLTIGSFGEPEVEEEKDAKGNVVSRTTHFENPPTAEASTALIVATRLSNEAVVSLLIKLGADVNRRDKHGITAIGWALRLGNRKLADILKQAGAAEPEFLEGSVQTALWLAARDGDAAKVEMLLQRGAKPDQLVEDREGKHLALVSAAREGHLDVVSLLLRHEANVNATAQENWAGGITPLMAAAREGHLEVVERLIAAGADVHAKDFGFEGGDETVLHYAARGGHPKVIKKLIAAGAKVNAKARGGSTPLLVAVSERKGEAAKALLEHGADPNAGPSDGSGPLYAAASENDCELVKLLLKSGAKVAATGKKVSFSPLEAAAAKGAVELVRVLLKAGFPVDGHDALGSAALFGHDDVVKVLLDAGAKANTSDRSGFTPLMGAVRSGNLTIVRLLIDAGADLSAATTDGDTALKIARQDKKKQIISEIESAMKKQPVKTPAAKSQARKTVQRAAKAGDEEEIEAPDFSEAAAQSEYQKTVKLLEKLCGVKAEDLGDIEGGNSFAVTRAKAEQLLSEHHESLLKKGVYFFRYHRDYKDQEDKLGLLLTTDWADLIRAFQTNGGNYDLMPEDIIRWLQQLCARQPFIVTGVGWDWLEGRFTGPVKQSRKLAHQMYEFCPDIVDQGVGSVKDLARTLEKDSYFFFWWD